MTTVGELIRDISFRMHSYTGIREQVTYLTAGISDTDTTLQVANGNRISRGLIEIEDELVLVDTVEANEVRLYPDGRAEHGSTAAAHGLNVRVTNDPLLPNVGIFQALKETSLQVHPELFQVKTTEITYEAARVSYELPSDVDRVLQVTADIPGVTRMWPQVKSWRFERSASTAEFATGKAIDLYECLTPGYTFRVTYAAPYTTPSTTSELLADLGVQDSVREVLLLGTCWRLTQNLEASRLQLQSVESMTRQEAVPVGATTNLAKQLYAMFAQRKAEERRRLLELHPAQIHRTR